MNTTQIAPRRETLTELCTSLQSGFRRCNASLRSIDAELAELNYLGLLNPSIVLGSIVMRRPYGLDCDYESDELVQAGVSSELGAVAIFWDSEDYLSYAQDGHLLREARKRARPLRECSAAVRAIVWPEVVPLVNQLLGQCEVMRFRN